MGLKAFQACLLLLPITVALTLSDSQGGPAEAQQSVTRTCLF